MSTCYNCCLLCSSLLEGKIPFVSAVAVEQMARSRILKFVSFLPSRTRDRFKKEGRIETQCCVRRVGPPDAWLSPFRIQ